MAKIKLLIDTDVLIDSLKGMKAVKYLFKTKEIDLFCSILSKKELLSKGGLGILAAASFIENPHSRKTGVIKNVFSY